MKSTVIHLSIFLSFLIIYSIPTFADIGFSKKKEVQKVEKLDRTPNLFKSEDMFFSGQPSLETLEWMASEGVDLVINLRSESENEDFTASAFNEEERASELGMKYISIPIDGYDSYTIENVEKLAKALKKKHNKVLIHCASCGRVSYFMIAYLTDYKGYKLSDAIAFGEQLKFRFPLEYLLEDEIDWNVK